MSSKIVETQMRLLQESSVKQMKSTKPSKNGKKGKKNSKAPHVAVKKTSFEGLKRGIAMDSRVQKAKASRQRGSNIAENISKLTTRTQATELAQRHMREALKML